MCEILFSKKIKEKMFQNVYQNFYPACFKLNSKGQACYPLIVIIPKGDNQCSQIIYSFERVVYHSLKCVCNLE